tara:strand:- start:1014 stop:2471 length:1458 start_codon:yes stop_codon:yes gene_type:complete
MGEMIETGEIRKFQRIYNQIRRLKSPPPEIIAQLEEGQKIIAGQGAIEQKFMGASEKQLALAEGIRNKKWRVVAACGANRSGKTVLTVDMGGAPFLRDKALDGAVVWAVSQNWKKSVLGLQQQFWNALPKDRFSKKWNAEYGFGHRGVVQFKTKDGGQAYIVFYNEQQELNVFETDAVNLVVWDEASKESILGRLRARVVDRQGQILISCLPEHLWLRFRIEKSNNPEWKFVQFTTYDNQQNLPRGEIEKMAADMTPEERKMRVDGEFVSLTGVIVKEFTPLLRPEGHLCEDFTPPRSWPVWVYIDVGQYTGATLLTVAPDETKYVIDEVYTLCQRADENARDIIEMLKDHDRTVSQVEGFKMDWNAWAYTASNELTLADQYEQAGIPCSRWPRTQDVGFKASINVLRRQFAQNRLFICEKAANLTHELQVWRWKMDDQQRIDDREKPDTGPDHLIDGVRAWLSDAPMYNTGDIDIIDTADDLDM